MTADVLGLFPPGSRVDGDGTVVVGGCRLDDLAEEFGTPVMVVAEDALRQRARDYLRAFRSRWPRSDVAFASKSFPCTAVQRVMGEEGLHLDVAGAGEIKAEMLMVWGRQDPHVPLEGRKKIYDALCEKGVNFTWHEFNAQHAFLRDEGPRHDPALARIGYGLALELFHRRLR